MVYAFIVVIVALVVLAPLFLFRPLILAIANRISGKFVDAEQLKLTQRKVEQLEQHIDHLQHRLTTIEDSSDFSKRLLEDLSKKTTVEVDKN